MTKKYGREELLRDLKDSERRYEEKQQNKGPVDKSVDFVKESIGTSRMKKRVEENPKNNLFFDFIKASKKSAAIVAFVAAGALSASYLTDNVDPNDVSQVQTPPNAEQIAEIQERLNEQESEPTLSADSVENTNTQEPPDFKFHDLTHSSEVDDFVDSVKESIEQDEFNPQMVDKFDTFDEDQQREIKQQLDQELSLFEKENLVNIVNSQPEQERQDVKEHFPRLKKYIR